MRADAPTTAILAPRERQVGGRTTTTPNGIGHVAPASSVGEYLTVPSLATSLGCDQAKILTWIHRGELRALNVAENASGRPRWRIPLEAWEAFEKARSNAPPVEIASPRRRRKADGYVLRFYR